VDEQEMRASGASAGGDRPEPPASAGGDRPEPPASAGGDRPEPAISPREAIADVRVRAPTRGNRRLERFLEAVNADTHIKALWHVSAVNASRRLGMSDHSWVHIQIVLNIGLRLARILFRRGVTPSVRADYGMSNHDAEVVIAAGCLFHCVGMSIHRDDHERYSLFLTADKLEGLLSSAYEEPERTVIASDAMHAIIGHRRDGAPFTVEAGIVRVADALDMARGRSRVPFEAGRHNIHSLSAYAIEEVKISPGRDRAVQVEITMSNSAGIFQVDELLAEKLRGSGLEEHIEVIARIDAEHEQRLITVFQI
jgi:uncharacterized protein